MTDRRRYKSYAWTHPKTKKLYARVQIRQPDGTLKTYYKAAKNMKHADQLAGEMLDDYAVRKTGFIVGEAMTFDDLAKWYKENKVVPPVYSADGTKVSGMRTHHNVKLRVEKLQKFLGKMLIKNIDEDVLAGVKLWLKKNSPESKPASINRYLEDLRAMMKLAVRKRWLKENPFDYGEKIIDSSLEETRKVVVTYDQELALLNVAKSREKTLLYYAMLCMLDTGARPSEIYNASTIEGEPVRWCDFADNDYQIVQLTSYKGKQKLVRFAPVSSRVESALTELFNSYKEKPKKTDQIFPVKSFKTSWTKVKEKAAKILTISEREKISLEKALKFDDKQIKGLFEKYQTEIDESKKYENLFEPLDIRLRDLRRTLNTRLANAGMENDLRQRILGHTEAQTNYDYTQADKQTAREAKKLIDNQIIETHGIN